MNKYEPQSPTYSDYTRPIAMKKFPRSSLKVSSGFRSHRSLKPMILLGAIMCTVIFMALSHDRISSVFLREVFDREEGSSSSWRSEAIPLRTTTAFGQLLQLHSLHEELAVEQRVEVSSDASILMVAPLNTTDQERMAWLRKNLDDFHIFKSDNTTMKFHRRVVKFFNDQCAGRFFMTWISPARFFGGRELLAVESLFKSNPGACLVILSRTLDSRAGHEVLKPITDHGFKVIPITPDLPSLFRKTPVDVWFNQLRNGKVDPGEISLAQNLSNLMRLAALYHYGGVYMDMDFIVLRDFTGLRNSIGAQSIDTVSGNWTRINNAVLVFDRHHPLLVKFMREFASTFNGSKWGHNGPYLVSRVIEKIQERQRNYAFNFTVLSPMAFYPVGWMRIGGLFEQPKSRDHERWVSAKVAQLSGKETYGLHLWNKQSRGLRIEEGSVLGRLISDHCVVCRDIYRSRDGISTMR